MVLLIILFVSVVILFWCHIVTTCPSDALRPNFGNRSRPISKLVVLNTNIRPFVSSWLRIFLKKFFSLLVQHSFEARPGQSPVCRVSNDPCWQPNPITGWYLSRSTEIHASGQLSWLVLLTFASIFFRWCVRFGL